jgi:hypothetical protein
MLAASDSSSMIMVNSRIWSMGLQQHEHFQPSAKEPNFLYSILMHVKAIDPQFFDNLPIAYVSPGPRHAAFVTTCGQLYMRGACSWRGTFYTMQRDNCLATTFRRTKQGVVGLCEKRPLTHPHLVPSELFGGEVCGLVREQIARQLAFLMGTHVRLRVTDCVACDAGFDVACLDSLLLKQILDLCDALLPALVRA